LHGPLARDDGHLNGMKQTEDELHQGSAPGNSITPQMNALVRSKDWSATPIGPVDRWSAALKMTVNFLLANRFSLLLWWGPEYVSIYNDAYRPILGTKHPVALGQPVKDV
jgi:hypothetical protein